MDTYSSTESSKPHSTNKAYVLNELKEAKRALSLKDDVMEKMEERLAIKDEAMQKLEERLAKVELKQEKSSHSIHGRHHSPRHSSKGSSNAHSHGEEHRRRRHHHHSHGESHHREQRHHQEAKPQFPFVKVPSFSDDSDPNVYLDWEAKCEQIFKAYKVTDDQKVKIASLEFIDYAMKWWHSICLLYTSPSPRD